MSNRHGSATVDLPSPCEIVITRKFEAPASLVFTAWTTPEYVSRWWSDELSPVTLCEIDLRVGGTWRYVTRHSDSGLEMGWHGEYREIVRSERLVSTEVFEGFADAESVNTLTLTECDGVTTMRVVVVAASPEARDGHINSGMEPGMQLAFDRCEDLIVGVRS